MFQWLLCLERILILLCSNVLHLVILFVNYMYFFFVHLFFFKLSPYFVYRGWVHLLRFSIKFHLFQSSREKTIFLKSILATFLHCKFKTRGKKISQMYLTIYQWRCNLKSFPNYLTTFYLKCKFYQKKSRERVASMSVLIFVSGVFWFLA